MPVQTDDPMRHLVRIFRAQRVITMAGPDATAFATCGEQVVAVGSGAEMRTRFPRAEVIDLDHVVVPGFHDAHAHPSWGAKSKLHVDLSPERVGNRAALTTALSEAAARTPPRRWIRAERYDHMRTTGGQSIDRAFLDGISREHPILVVHIAGHWAVTNSAGLTAGGLDDDTEPPAGGDLGRDGAGRLNGLLYERSLSAYTSPTAGRPAPILPEPAPEEFLQGLDQFAGELHAAGVTSICDALVSPQVLRHYQEAERRGRLSLRVATLIRHPFLDGLADVGIMSGFGGDRVRVVGVKAFVDGAVAGRTCLLDRPFHDSAGHDDHGIQVADVAMLTDLAIRAQRAGIRLGVHANGDRAISLLLDALEAADRATPERTRLRHRIEHCSIVTPEILARMRALDLIAVPFGSYVWYHGDALLEWYGAARLERMFAHRSFLDSGITVAGSSDYPCGPVEPLLAVQSCVTRTSANGDLLGPSQRISVREALALYTVGSASATGEEATKGRLAPGYLADFVVLGADPETSAPDEIGRIPVVSTWVGAEQVTSRTA
ncbi:amidohydrolase [Sciscionella marina]|uniref:amidohydrolase n=1 Tax=Sciscionella marina TaxID=508770 RepID=UPI0003675CFC|nr:amidohydrolase [Sciscionella marina]